VAVRNVRLLRVLERVAAAFHEHELPLLVMKGGALILTVYPPGDRPMDDLDLLVRPEHFAEACRSLEAIGARPGRPLIRKDFCPRYYYETEFLIGAVDPVKLDLHVRPFRPLPCAQFVPADALWRHAREVRLGNSTVLIPSADEMLVHLAAHAAFHACSRRVWLLDLKVWGDAHQHEIDWARVCETAERWRLALPCGVAFRAAREIGFIAPGNVMPRLSQTRAPWRDRFMLWQAPRDAQHPVAHILVNCICTPGWRFRLGYLRSIALPDAAHMREWCNIRGIRSKLACRLALVSRCSQAAWSIARIAARWTQMAIAQAAGSSSASSWARPGVRTSCAKECA
jgi:hypothetical protein